MTKQRTNRPTTPATAPTVPIEPAAVSITPPAVPPTAPEQPADAPPVEVGAAVPVPPRNETADSRADAGRLLTSAVTAFRRGESDYRRGCLEAGRLCDAYVAARLALRDDRAAAVQAIEGELAQYASSPVRANDLIAAYHAYRLLVADRGMAKSIGERVPYGTYRDRWSRLVERVQTADGETWCLSPHLDDTLPDGSTTNQAVLEFDHAAEHKLSSAAVAERVAALQEVIQQRKAAAVRAAAKAKADAQTAADKAVTAEKETAIAATAAATAAAAELATVTAAAVTETDSAKRETLTAAVVAAAEVAETKERERIAANSALELAEIKKARTDSEAKKAERAQADLEAREKARKERADKKNGVKAPAAPAADCRAENLMITRGSDPKDVADMISRAVATHEDPLAVIHELVGCLVIRVGGIKDAVFGADDVWAAILSGVDGNPELSKRSQRSIANATLSLGKVLAAPTAPTAPSANGVLVGAS